MGIQSGICLDFSIPELAQRNKECSDNVLANYLWYSFKQYTFIPVSHRIALRSLDGILFPAFLTKLSLLWEVCVLAFHLLNIPWS